jgi:serine/threonine protein kinase
LNGRGDCVSCLLRAGLDDEEQRAEVNQGDLPVSAIIGNYRVVRELGRGGMGAVYLAERADAQYKRQVAIKLIKRGMDTDSVLRHFRNERQILANFDHANIGRLFDSGTTDDGLPYLLWNTSTVCRLIATVMRTTCRSIKG